MNNTTHKKGFTLTELLVTIGVMATMIGIGVPATKAVLNSVNSSAGVRNMLTACLGNARAIAIKEQKYAGIRFQPDAEGNQYMVFIVHDDASAPAAGADPEFTGTGLAYGFRAVTGRKPIKLPGDARVMDLKLRADYTGTVPAADVLPNPPVGINANTLIDDDIEVYDTSTFAIIFTPAGKLVTQQVRVRNRHGQLESGYDSADKIFNVNGAALLYQDDFIDSDNDGADDIFLGQEYSRKSFIIYDRRKFAGVDSGERWEKYLKYFVRDDTAVPPIEGKEIYVNPYTGEIVGGQLEK